MATNSRPFSAKPDDAGAVYATGLRSEFIVCSAPPSANAINAHTKCFNIAYPNFAKAVSRQNSSCSFWRVFGAFMAFGFSLFCTNT